MADIEVTPVIATRRDHAMGLLGRMLSRGLGSGYAHRPAASTTTTPCSRESTASSPSTSTSQGVRRGRSRCSMG